MGALVANVVVSGVVVGCVSRAGSGHSLKLCCFSKKHVVFSFPRGDALDRLWTQKWKTTQKNNAKIDTDRTGLSACEKTRL